MNDVEIKLVFKHDFNEISQEIYNRVFSGDSETKRDRIDFAFIFFYRGKIGGYVTCYEHSQRELFIQLGGIVSRYSDSIPIYKALDRTIDHLLSRYRYINTLIENDNIFLLRLALKRGWTIIGTRLNPDRTLLVELLKQSYLESENNFN